MHFYESEVSLKVTSRPLRLAYLVQSRDDIINAVTLYTHLWGGAGNNMMPVPRNELEAGNLKFGLEQLSPDYIFLPVPIQELPDHTREVLEQYPSVKFDVSKDAIWEHIDGYNPLPLRGGKLSYVPLLLEKLYPTGLDQSIIALPAEGDSFDFAIDLQAGVYSSDYGNYLEHTLAAIVLDPTNTVEELLHTCFNLSRFHNPTSLTMIETKQSWNVGVSNMLWITDQDILCLFLDDGEDINVATAFWNSRKITRENKLFLPRDAFLNNLSSNVAMIIDNLSSIRGIFITTPTDHKNAIGLRTEIKNAFAAAGRDITVRVRYDSFGYDYPNVAIYSGQPESLTRVIGADGAIRLRPPTPFGHENTEFAFGYDAEVEFVSGRHLSMPSTLPGSVLLSNEKERIERADEDYRWLRGAFTVRPMIKGISGTAQAGDETRFYIHLDDYIVSKHLKYAGFEVKPNPHTRYAQGVVNRFEGINKVSSLVGKGGVEIILALNAHRAQQNGFLREQIIGYLQNQRALTNHEATASVNEQLPLLLRAGLVRRGYPLRCPHCDLNDWYSVEKIQELIECGGCAQLFQLPYKIQFAYKANELAARFVKEGGQAVLMVTALLLEIENLGFIQYGGDLLHIGSSTAFAEVDIFWLTEQAFTIAECKSIHQIGQLELSQIKDSLEKTIEAAALIGAGVVILGVSTSSDIIDLCNVVADASQGAQQQGIGVHLICNGKLYLWGNQDETDTLMINLQHLLCTRQEVQTEKSVGELPIHGYI